jgi:hypothetical protein
MTSEAQLQTWISESRSNQRYLKGVVLVLGVLSALVSLSSHRIGFVMFLFTAVVAVAGFWVLAAHISDWQGQLRRRQTAR